MDYSVQPGSIEPSPKDFGVLQSVYADIDWFDSYARLDPVTCPPSKLAEVAAACSCDGPSPGFSWGNEQEYIVCVDFIVEDTGCDRQDVIDLAKCIPFDLPTASPTKPPTKRPTRSPTQTPTRPLTLEPTARPVRQIGERSPNGDGNQTTPTNEPTKVPSPLPTTGPTMPFPTDYPTAKPSPSADVCSPALLARLAQVCSCSGPNTNQAWAAEDEYLQCVDFAAQNTPCPAQALIDLAGCLPFRNRTVQPTLSPTMRAADRLATSSPTEMDIISDTSGITIPPTSTPTKGPSHYPTRVPTKAPSNKLPTLADDGLVSGTNPPTKNPTQSPTKPPTPGPSPAPTTTIRFPTIRTKGPPTVPRGKRTKKTSSGNNPNQNATCGQIHDEDGCKGSRGICKWSKKESRCQNKTNRRRQLTIELGTAPAEQLYHHHESPEEETVEHHTVRASFGQVYHSVTADDDSLCHDRASFGIPPEAILVIAHEKSCRFAIQSGSTVEVIEVLL